MVNDATSAHGVPPEHAVQRSPQSLLARLTLPEKIAMLHQTSPRVERLGLAAYRTGTEALHGVAWLGTATVFPQPVGLGATWDPELLTAIGNAVATEVRAKHAADHSVSLNVWAPVANPLRHPRWGRNEEGFSEDPDLTSLLAAAYAAGLRGTHPDVWKTVPTAKHFLGYGHESDRTVTSAHLPPQALREYELPAFDNTVAEGNIGAVMPSYNLVNGRPNHVARDLIEELRSWAPHDIAVLSDAQAPSNLVDDQHYFSDHPTAHAAALLAEVDSFTDNDDDPAPTIARVTSALSAGAITEHDIDRAVLRILGLRARTGELGGQDPYAITPDHIDTPEHRRLARLAVARSVVVLANDGATLPFPQPRTIAVVGPFADQVVRDWYSGTPPYVRTIADAIAERYPTAHLRVASGAERVALRAQSTGRYLEVTDSSNLRARATKAIPRTHLDLTDWGEGIHTLRSVSNGLLLSGSNRRVAATADRVGGWVAQEGFRIQHHPDGSVSLQHAGNGLWLRVERGSNLLVADASAQMAEHFSLITVRSGSLSVAQACTDADVTIVAVGNEPHILGRETQDRPHLALPDHALELWRAAAEAGPAPVVVIVSSYPYVLPQQRETAGAIVWTSHGGQELGSGLVDVLSGDTEPSGRLAQTWWADERHAGDLMEYDVVGARMTYRYSAAAPLYGLGHGLGYSTVEYESIRLSADRMVAPDPTLRHTPARRSHSAATDQTDIEWLGLTASVWIHNTGDRVAHELVAVYTLAPDLPVVVPERRFAGFTRVTLQPGERREVRVGIALGILAVWDVGADAGETLAATPGAYRVQAGTYRFGAGPSVADLQVLTELTVETDSPRVRRPSIIEAHAFHASHGIVTSDLLPEGGSSIEVASLHETGWTRYDNLDLSSSTNLAAVVALRDEPGWDGNEIRLDVRPAGQTDTSWQHAAGPVVVDATSRCGWTVHELPLTIPPQLLGSPVDVRITLRGAARLCRLSLRP